MRAGRGSLPSAPALRAPSLSRWPAPRSWSRCCLAGQGRPPWSLGWHPSAYLVVAADAAGLGGNARAGGSCYAHWRAGWAVPAWAIVAAGLLAATALTLVPPFGSSDHLSYAAYGRCSSPATTPTPRLPAQLAALGDPVARAVQDWSASPSVYGPLATAIPGTGLAVRRYLGAAHRVRSRPGQPGRLRRDRAAPAPHDARSAGPPAAGRLAVGRQPAAAPGARRGRARGHPGRGVRRRRGTDVLARGGGRLFRHCRASWPRAAAAGILVGLGSASRSRPPGRAGVGHRPGAAARTAAALVAPLAALGAGFAVTAAAAIAIGGPPCSGNRSRPATWCRSDRRGG